MKKIALIVALALSRTAFAMPDCIDQKIAARDTQILPSSPEEYLPALPDGWEWIKVYRIDLDPPYTWYWQSWPKALCPANIEGPKNL